MKQQLKEVKASIKAATADLKTALSDCDGDVLKDSAKNLASLFKKKAKLEEKLANAE